MPTPSPVASAIVIHQYSMLCPPPPLSPLLGNVRGVVQALPNICSNQLMKLTNECKHIISYDIQDKPINDIT